MITSQPIETPEIVEVSPRDGLQNEAVRVPTTAKADLVDRLTAAGCRRIEVTSFVNPKAVPQMADAEELISRLSVYDTRQFSALVVNKRGFERAQDCGIGEVNFVLLATEEFNRRNQGKPVQESVEEWADISRLCGAAGIQTTVTVGAAFGCPFEGEVSESRLADVLSSIVETAPPDELCLADTIGVGVPSQVGRRLGMAKELAPSMKLRCHFHNTRNTGYANAWAAVMEGIDALDSSVGGIGGCPFSPEATGNIATEDLLYLLGRSGVEPPIDVAALRSWSSWLEGIIQRPLPSLVSKALPFPG